MKLAWLLAGVLAITTPVSAQSALPAGTLLPVSLDHGWNAAKLHSGQTVRVRLMQSVPGTGLHSGAHVVGRVVTVATAPGAPAQLAIRFDSVENHGRQIPITADLRALASPMEVQQAQVPEEMASRGLTPQTWTTQQIGGDQVYRGGGPVAEGITTVGKPVPGGVIGQPLAQSGAPCRGQIQENDRPQALWLFSANACGVYGFPDLRIDHAGRRDGTIVLASNSGKINIGGGSALLLRVNESGQ